MDAQTLLNLLYTGAGIVADKEITGLKLSDCVSDDCDCACGCGGGGNCEP